MPPIRHAPGTSLRLSRALDRPTKQTVALALCALALGALACGEAPTDREEASIAISMRFGAQEDFFAAPFPSAHRVDPGSGRIALGDFANPQRIELVQRIVDVLQSDADGFGLTTGMFFRLSAAPTSLRLPALFESLQPESPALIVGVDPAAPDYGRRYPIETDFAADAGPFGGAHLLTLLPYQGIPLRPHALYAAVVLRDIASPALAGSDVVAQIAADEIPDGLSVQAFGTYRAALHALADLRVDLDDIAGLAVFRTGDPVAGMRAAHASLRSKETPVAEAPFALTDVFDEYCVFESTIAMPVAQAGEPPYARSGGAWVFDQRGAVVVQRHERARIVVTLPRRTMPAAGFPLVVFSRTGGGGERPLVDRGPRAIAGGPAIRAGEGPARTFAQAGYAGLSIDGPHGGLRNVTRGDEQFLVFNVLNPPALRDNLRQSALELMLAADIAAALDLAGGECPDLDATHARGRVRIDAATMVLMGHSMGASILPLAFALEPRFKAAILSGAGGSFINNIIFKRKPLETRAVAEAILGFNGRTLTRFDPVLSMAQWAAEPSDVPPYAALYDAALNEGSAARHVLMLQGIVDNYIPPPVANTTTLSLGLDLAGAALDAGAPMTESVPPLVDLLPLTARRQIDLPARGNRAGGTVTALVVQHAEDGIEDGHEIMFQREEPQRQLQCFLVTLARGVPQVPLASAGACES